MLKRLDFYQFRIPGERNKIPKREASEIRCVDPKTGWAAVERKNQNEKHACIYISRPGGFQGLSMHLK